MICVNPIQKRINIEYGGRLVARSCSYKLNTKDFNQLRTSDRVRAPGNHDFTVSLRLARGLK